jgi:hypothetical protein
MQRYLEPKMSEARIDPSLRYFRDRVHVPWAYQVVLQTEKDYVADGIRCLPASRFLAALM